MTALQVTEKVQPALTVATQLAAKGRVTELWLAELKLAAMTVATVCLLIQSVAARASLTWTAWTACRRFTLASFPLRVRALLAA
jgi:hypothetical protein